jgi:hypothetical protein
VTTRPVGSDPSGLGRAGPGLAGHGVASSGTAWDPVVAFTVGGRVSYLRETLASWSNVRGIEGAELIFCCEPGHYEAAQMCREVEFAPVLCSVNPSRFGVLRNPWHAFDTAFRGYEADFAVLAEEDITVSPDALEFFAWCQRYRDDSSVLAVSLHQRDAQPGGLAGVTTARWDYDGAHMWVWGTWRDRWENLLRDDWDFAYEENGGGPLQRGFDWRIRNKYCLQQGMRVIAPCMSRAQHIGKYGGAHATPAQYAGLKSRCFAGPDVGPQDYREVT